MAVEKNQSARPEHAPRADAGRGARADRADTGHGAPADQAQSGHGAQAELPPARGRPVVRHLVILAGYLAAGIAVTWPRAAYLVQARLPNYGDVVSYVWDLWWTAHQVIHLGNPFFTGHMAAPAGIQLAFNTTDPAARRW